MHPLSRKFGGFFSNDSDRSDDTDSGDSSSSDDDDDKKSHHSKSKKSSSSGSGKSGNKYRPIHQVLAAQRIVAGGARGADDESSFEIGPLSPSSAESSSDEDKGKPKPKPIISAPAPVPASQQVRPNNVPQFNNNNKRPPPPPINTRRSSTPAPQVGSTTELDDAEMDRFASALRVTATPPPSPALVSAAKPQSNRGSLKRAAASSGNSSEKMNKKILANAESSDAKEQQADEPKEVEKVKEATGTKDVKEVNVAKETTTTCPAGLSLFTHGNGTLRAMEYVLRTYTDHGELWGTTSSLYHVEQQLNPKDPPPAEHHPILLSAFWFTTFQVDLSYFPIPPAKPLEMMAQTITQQGPVGCMSFIVQTFPHYYIDAASRKKKSQYRCCITSPVAGRQCSPAHSVATCQNVFFSAQVFANEDNVLSLPPGNEQALYLDLQVGYVTSSTNNVFSQSSLANINEAVRDELQQFRLYWSARVRALHTHL